MSKDVNDSVTMALIPEPKKRGRPASGKALSNAERQRRFRENKKVRTQVDFSVASELLAALSGVLDAPTDLSVISSAKRKQAYDFARSVISKVPNFLEENRYKGE